MLVDIIKQSMTKIEVTQEDGFDWDRGECTKCGEDEVLEQAVIAEGDERTF